MSNQPQTILPEDFGLPGPGGSYGPHKERDLGPRRSLMMSMVIYMMGRLMVSLLVTIAMPLFMVAMAWWMYPAEVSAAMNFLISFNDNLDPNPWADWSKALLGRFARGSV